MRPTLHEFVIGFDSDAQTITDSVMDFIELVCKYAELTNRAPRLGDFVPCDEDGNVLEKPDIHSLDHSTAVATHNEYQQAQSRVIFKGEWRIISDGLIGSNVLKRQMLFDDYFVVFNKWMGIGFLKEKINRIEDLPREIEFKEGVI